MHEYKVVPAPLRAGRVKGLRSTADRFAHGMSELLNEWAAQGWDYVRTETFTVEERRGLFGRRVSTAQTVLILRRERVERAASLPPARERAPAQPLPRPGPPPGRAPAPAAAEPEPGAPQAPDMRPEPTFRPGALLRPEGARKYPPLRRTEATATPEG